MHKGEQLFPYCRKVVGNIANVYDFTPRAAKKKNLSGTTRRRAALKLREHLEQNERVDPVDAGGSAENARPAGIEVRRVGVISVQSHTSEGAPYGGRW